MVIGLNIWLASIAIGQWLDTAGTWRMVVWLVTVPTAILLLLLLLSAVIDSNAAEPDRGRLFDHAQLTKINAR